MSSSNQDFESLVQRYELVLDTISKSAESVQRDPSDIQLVVVTKGHPIELTRWVISAGAQILGENYIEEGLDKITAIGESSSVNWHMIGHLQSRKSRKMCKYFSVFQALDTIKLAMRLDRIAGELGKKLPVLLECNLSGEASKFGFACWDQALIGDFLKEIEPLIKLENLIVQGLMTIPLFDNDPETSRPYYRNLRTIKARANEIYPELPIKELSMGMSNDYEIAIQEGATIVRIGQAILGERPKK